METNEAILSQQWIIFIDVHLLFMKSLSTKTEFAQFWAWMTGNKDVLHSLQTLTHCSYL